MGSKKRKRKEKLAQQQSLHQGQARYCNGWGTNDIQATKAPLWQYFIPPVLLSLLTALFYYPSMRYDFQFDDIANIQKCFNIRHNTLGQLFFSGPRWITYWLNTIHYKITQFNPISYRIGNILIHLTSGILIFFIIFTALRHLKQKNFFTKHYFSIAFLTSLLFLLHPVQTQTVSYVIQGQLEGLAGLCIFAMTFLFLKASYTQIPFARFLYTLLLFVVAAFSCGTKEIAIISPAILLLVDWFFVAQGSWESIKKRLYIHIPIALLVFTIYLYFLKPKFFTDILGLQKVAKNNIGNVITQNPATKITPWMFFRSQFKVILHYLWMFIYPLGISVEYDWVLSKSFFAPDCLLPFIALALIGTTIIKILARNKASMIAFGALWFFLAISPRSSIIPSPELLVDYKTYTASFGWLFLIASGIIFAIQKIRLAINKPQPSPVIHTTEQLPPELAHELPTEPQKKTPVPLYITITASLLIAVITGLLTRQRNTIWESGLAFWGDMVKKAPGKARAYNNYGVELSQKSHDFHGSIPYFKKAIKMDKHYPDPWNNLSVAYANIGKIDEAINALKHSIKIYPYYPENYNNLASFYLQKNDLDQAEKLLKTAIKLRGHYGKAHFNMGRVFYARGDKEEAWKWFKKCCTECDFDNAPHGFAIYAKVSMALKKYDDAIFGYTKALSFEPQNMDTAFNLANAYFMDTKYDNAINIYKQILHANPRNAKAQYNLGEAYISQKKYELALECYEKAKRMPNMSKIFPYFNIRLANCLEKLGRPQEAKKTLETFIALNNGNNQQVKMIQSQARSLLAQLNGKYSGKAAAAA